LFLCSDIPFEEKQKLDDYLQLLEDSGVGKIIEQAIGKHSEKGVLPYATGESSAARRAPCQPPSGGTNTTLPVVPEARQKAPMPATPESGAISRRYPVVLPRSSDRSVLAYVTGAATTARPAGASEIAP